MTLLGEITKGKQKLKIIDHGDKKLLFNWAKNDDIIFVLIIEKDLVAIRHKLEEFSNDFEEKFKEKLIDFSGVNVNNWKPTKELINSHFKCKY